MAKRWKRTETWLMVAILAVCLLVLAVPGLWVYMSLTTTPIHTDQREVPATSPSAPPPEWAGRAEHARRIVRASLVDQNLPGVSVAVGIGGHIVWAEGFGFADLEDRVPVATDTPFRIGTASKMITAAAVGLLLEEGRIELDGAIQTYVPGFPTKPWPVTLRQLMGHVAGVRNDAGDEEPVWVPCKGTREALPRFAERPLLFEPGTRYHYSNYGWVLVTAAVEAAAAEPFHSLMKTKVFERLGMQHTGIDAGTELFPNRATYYFPRFAADPRYGPQPPAEVDYSCFAGSSGILSTPSDLVRFGMAFHSGTLLQPGTVQLLLTSQRLASGQETGYGLGWDLETVELAGAQVGVVGSDGELRGGTVASFLTIPATGLVVAATSNISYADTATLVLDIARAFSGAAGSGRQAQSP